MPQIGSRKVGGKKRAERATPAVPAKKAPLSPSHKSVKKQRGRKKITNFPFIVYFQSTIFLHASTINIKIENFFLLKNSCGISCRDAPKKRTQREKSINNPGAASVPPVLLA